MLKVKPLEERLQKLFLKMEPDENYISNYNKEVEKYNISLFQKLENEIKRFI